MIPPDAVAATEAAGDATPREDGARPYKDLPAVTMLRERTKGFSQAVVGQRCDCTQPVISDVLAGKSRFGARRRALAFRAFGIPLEAWLTPSELPSDAAHSASQPATPQADRTSSPPSFSEPAPEAA